MDFEHEAIHYLEVDFPAPTPAGAENRDRAQAVGIAHRDKHRKIHKGILHAKTLNPSHIMFMDADDLVSNQIVEFVINHKENAGWYISSGFEYFEGSKKLFPRPEKFFSKCGSSHIVQFKILEEIAETISSEDVHPRFLHHQEVRRLVKEQGASLEALPFAGAVYITEHGENLWASKENLLQMFGKTPKAVVMFYLRTFYKNIVSKNVSPVFAKEYGLYDIGTPA